MSLLTRLITATLVSGLTIIAHAQPDSLSQPGLKRNVPLNEQRDVLGVARKLLPFLHLKNEADAVTLPVCRMFVWVLPEGGYSLQTRLLVEIQGNIAYRRPGANVSTIIPAVAYSQNHQLFFATRLNSWTRNNRFN
ncbi:hypothetical protein EXU85_02710 [Spirosoma sp. KCTC 42546]|uniref:hypothetical protein n=1 Tax=Spirosoma sp. KCTC 42546 TaxID=2520506 RepID=UPI0011571EB1|nr:hypothetical protein [Spirosoma sp. KCTC 42546]QDK77564.1 hypothetical protein EXU85_02710 [Spirosoma sp. KCTC 42546]